jgi:hypothetical protein
MTLFLWCFYWFFSCCSLYRCSSFSNDCLILFLKFIFWHVSKRDSKTSFSNQILHIANPHDNLSTFMLYPSLGFPSIYRLTLWDSGLGHLSLVTCRMEVLRWRIWALTISIFCLEWLRYGWFSISLFMAFNSRVTLWHLHLLCELSYTLYFTLTCNVEFFYVLTWSS